MSVFACTNISMLTKTKQGKKERNKKHHQQRCLNIKRENAMPSLYLFLIPILVTVCSGNEDNEEYGKNLRRLQEDDLANQCMGQNNRRTLKCLRFTKIEERDDSSWPRFPLSATQYNLKRGTLSNVKKMGAASFINNLEDVAPNPYKYDDSTFQAIVSEPTHPTCNPKSEFWKEFKEVYDLQKRRVENGNQMKACNVMPVPSLWKDKTLDEVAEEVHDEVRISQFNYFKVFLYSYSNFFFV